jgi:adenylate kinase family enzyme
MKIHIFGASGSGVTTLGRALATEMNIPYFDSDQYFWAPSDLPFTIKRNPEERNKLIRTALTSNKCWIFGGSALKWGENVFPEFDLIVFLWLPPEIRLERLRKREFERYGPIIYTDSERIKNYQDFMDWAANYDVDPDESGFTGRSLKVHENWLNQVSAQVLEIRGDFTVPERVTKIINFMKKAP